MRTPRKKLPNNIANSIKKIPKKTLPKGTVFWFIDIHSEPHYSRFLAMPTLGDIGLTLQYKYYLAYQKEKEQDLRIFELVTTKDLEVAVMDAAHQPEATMGELGLPYINDDNGIWDNYTSANALCENSRGLGIAGWTEDIHAEPDRIKGNEAMVCVPDDDNTLYPVTIRHTWTLPEFLINQKENLLKLLDHNEQDTKDIADIFVDMLPGNEYAPQALNYFMMKGSFLAKATSNYRKKYKLNHKN
jgi:hypothetical protein